MAKPKLITKLAGPHGDPIVRHCSECNENIEENQPPTKEGTIDAAWQLHLKQKHSSEDVNQAAARIVREATHD